MCLFVWKWLATLQRERILMEALDLVAYWTRYCSFLATFSFPFHICFVFLALFFKFYSTSNCLKLRCSGPLNWKRYHCDTVVGQIAVCFWSENKGVKVGSFTCSLRRRGISRDLCAVLFFQCLERDGGRLSILNSKQFYSSSSYDDLSIRPSPLKRCCFPFLSLYFLYVFFFLFGDPFLRYWRNTFRQRFFFTLFKQYSLTTIFLLRYCSIFFGQRSVFTVPQQNFLLWM